MIVGVLGLAVLTGLGGAIYTLCAGGSVLMALAAYSGFGMLGMACGAAALAVRSSVTIGRVRAQSKRALLSPRSLRRA